MPSLLQATVLFLSFGLLCSAGSCDRTTSSSSSSSSKPTSTVIKSSTIKSSSTSAIKSSSTSAIKSSATSTSRPSSTPTPTPKSSSGSSAASVPAGFKPGVKWQIAIQDPVDIRGGLEPLDAKVMDVDLFLASKDHTLIPGLHAAGITVLCYFNAGAIQYTDCDFPTWQSGGLFKGKSVANYNQEKYVDVTSSAVINLHKARVDLAHSIGCDGIDPDNIDTYELTPSQSIGKQITQDNMISFLKTLADYTHSKTTPWGKPMMIGQKNAAEITESVHSFMDFAVSENCVGSNNVGSNRGDTAEFCTNFQHFYVNYGKPVFDIEYPGSLASSSSSKRRRDALNIDDDEAGCSEATSASDVQFYCAMSSSRNNTGISRILKLDNNQFGLNGCTQYCGEAASFVLPAYQSNETNSCCFGSSC